MTAYDVVVIGGGPGGYVAAIKSAQLGKKTAVVEKQWLGGVCLNIGCIPSKALLKNADVAHMLREGGREFGFKVEGLELDFPSAVKRSRQVSGRLTKGVGFLMKKHKIDVYMGTAAFKDRSTLAVTLNDGGEEELKAENIIIATGASSMIIPGMEPDGEAVLTYTEAILQEKLPKSVVIVGAGAIGLEFATIWNAYGSEITIVEMMPRIAPLEDEEASAEVEKAFKKRKITCLTGTKVDSIKKVKGGFAVFFFFLLFLVWLGRPLLCVVRSKLRYEVRSTRVHPCRRPLKMTLPQRRNRRRDRKTDARTCGFRPGNYLR